MFTYNICTVTDKKLYDKSIIKLKGIDGMKFVETLNDVDGSLYGVFTYMGKNVYVKNDEYIGALYIESEEDIESILFT